MGALTDFLGAGEVATALGGVVTALLDKLEHAVGWCANHDTPSRTAVNTYIEEKYSLQGTTQGRYLTGGVPPVRFSM